MGCDIHTYAERKVGDAYELISDLTPFDWRSYGMYGFLADVRNSSDVAPISQPRGLPNDVSAGTAEAYGDGVDWHTASWLSVAELADFNYDQPMEDRRVTIQLASNMWSGAGTAAPGGGEMTTYREFLGDAYFVDLDKLILAGINRVVFWFDN